MSDSSDKGHTIGDALCRLIGLAVFVAWVAGVIIADGFWMTLFAIFPPVGWFLFVHRGLEVSGWLM